MLTTNKKGFEKYFRKNILPEIKKQEHAGVDHIRRAQAWVIQIDYLVKDNQLPQRAESWLSPWQRKINRTVEI